MLKCLLGVFRNDDAVVLELVAKRGHNLADFVGGVARRERDLLLRAAREVNALLDAAHTPGNQAGNNNRQGNAEPAPLVLHHVPAPDVRFARHAEHAGIVAQVGVDERKQKRARDGNGRKHADYDAQSQCQRKAAYGAGSKLVQNAAGDNGTHVAVENGRKRALESGVNGGAQVLAAAQFFLEPLKNQDIGVYRHADGQDKPGDTGQSERNRPEFEQREGKQRIQNQREVGEQAGQPIPEQHKYEDE